MKEVKEKMRAAIFDVFERMFYVFLEPIDDENFVYAMEASIRFTGAQKGELRILVSEGLAKTMVRNLLGLEGEKIVEQDIADCVKEAVNMVCGNFLGKLDPTKVFDLSMPSFSRHPVDVKREGNIFGLCFDSDGERFGAILTLSD